jgi:preprotein translocase subunit SecG
VGGLSNNFMGVKQTTDVLEKGTWIFASVIAVLAITSTLFLSGNASNSNSVLDKVNTSTSTSPATQAAPPQPPAATDTNKK